MVVSKDIFFSFSVVGVSSLLLSLYYNYGHGTAWHAKQLVSSSYILELEIGELNTFFIVSPEK